MFAQKNYGCPLCVEFNPLGFRSGQLCPKHARLVSIAKVSRQLNKEEFFGSSPAPFVGRFGYPDVNLGILSPPERTEEAWLHDAPRHWAAERYEIPQIVDLRSSLINSRFRINIKEHNKLLMIGQEVGMASKPVDIEVKLKARPSFRINIEYNAPMGPNATLRNIAITSNPKIHTKVDKVVSDTDLRAGEALTYLYENEFDENFLSKLLSVGTLGLEKNRKLVPTRFSITATDDTLGKHLIKDIKQFKEADYLAFFGGYLGNYYLILTFPEVWSYELFESYASDKRNFNDRIPHETDYEPYTGRKYYAKETVGGYYAARFAILEKLKEIKRQASVLALRFVTDEYYMPLGVFVVREATRNAINNKPIEFSSLELMLNYAKELVKKKFNINLNLLLSESILLRNIKTQKKVTEFV